MNAAASGLAGTPTVVLYASTEHDTEPTGSRLIKLGTLEPTMRTDWELLLRENPNLVADLASALAVAVRIDPLDAPTSSEDASCPSHYTGERTSDADPEAAQEPASQQRTSRTTGKRSQSSGGKRARRSSNRAVEDTARFETTPNLGRAWLSMVRSSQGSRHPITEETQGTQEQTSHETGNQSQGTFTESHTEDPDPNTETERKRKSDQIFPPSDPPPSPHAESGHFSTNARSNRLRPEYTPTPQYMNEEHACPFWGRHFSRTAHPEGSAKVTPFPCGTCDQCREYKKFDRSERYWASEPSPTVTVLTVEFADIESADQFAKLPAHRSRIPSIRKHVGFQQSDGWVLDEPCMVRILWDAVATDKQQKAILRHANKSKATAVALDVRPVSASEFKDWLPDQSTIVLDSGKKVYASRFSSGWAQEQKPPDDWRNGFTRRVIEEDKTKWSSRPIQAKRAKELRASWIHHYKRARMLLLHPLEHQHAEDQQLAEQEAQARLERTRYVNTQDWLRRWKTFAPLHIELTRDFIEAYLRGENPDVRGWQKITLGPKALPVEVARWLNGEREPEPAILLAADWLGYNTPLEPYIDADFLRELTASLSPLEFRETSKAGYAPSDIPERMAA